MAAQRYIRLSQLVGLVVAGVGALVLILGWFLGVQVVTNLRADLPEMKANTALGLFLLGLALAACRQDGTVRLPPWFAEVGATLGVLIGAATLVEHMTGTSLGIDQLLAIDAGESPHPGRMSQAGALEFVLMGCGLPLLKRPRPVVTIGISLVAIGTGLALLVTVGHLYGVPGTENWLVGRRMAPLSALSFYLLGLGMLSFREDEGIAQVLGDSSPGGALARLMLPAAVVLPVLLGAVRLWGQRAGYYGTELGLTLYVTLIVSVLCGLVVMAAQQLREQDQTRREAEHRLQADHDARLLLVEEQTQELRRSELRYRTLVNRIPNAIVVLFDRDLRCIYMDGEDLMTLLGLRRERFEGHLLIEGMSAENRPALEAAYRAALEGESRTTDMSFGAGRSASIRTTPVRNEAGEIVGGFSLLYDVTDIRHTEEQLRRTLAVQRAILDSAGAAIIATTTDGLITEFNPAASRLLGYSIAEIVGHATPALFHDPEEIEGRASKLSQELGRPVAAGVDALIARARLGIADDNEWTYVRKDGTRLPVRVTVTAMRDGASVITGFLCMATDITERRHTIAELMRAADLAEQAVRARSDFLARMSHEIRTPMNGVLGMTELALQTRLTTEQRSYVETARESASSLLSLINDILDFSKIDAGRLQLERIPFRLRDMASTAVRTLAPRAQEKGLEVLLHIPFELPDAFVGDPNRLRQILTNLIGNAIKFTDRGEVAVEVMAGPLTSAGRTLEFIVRDTGLGIPLEKQAGLFEAFSQAEADTSRKYGGTGLGLAICSQLAQMMGGRVWVESALGAGSRFHVSIVIPEAAGDPGLWRAEHPSLKALRALVVDDHAGQRGVLAELLSGWRMRPTAVTAAEAPEEVQRAHEQADPYRILLVDAEMPNVDSFALVEALRRLNAGRTPLVILTIGARTPGPDVEARLTPMACLPKPVSSSQLLETIEALMDGRHEERVTPRITTTRPTVRPLRILVAEDNIINQRVAQALLQKAGHAVVVVDDGRKALAAVARERFDVILMDVQMPEMDGLEATRTLRATEQAQGSARIPIIALTAQAMKGDAEQCLAAGMDAYVSKPLDLASLLATLERVTNSASLAPAERPPETA